MNKDLKISLIMPIAYDYMYAYKALTAVYNIVDEIILGIDNENISWSGKKYFFDKLSFKNLINTIDLQNKVTIVEKNFHKFSPIDNDIYERNILSEAANKDNWILSVDSDEYALNPEVFKLFLLSNNFIKTDILARLVNVFKIINNDKYLLTVPKSPDLDYMPVATFSKGEFKEPRKTGNNVVLSPLNLLHYTWGRTRLELENKLSNWSHSNDFDTKLYLSFWDKINLNNYHLAKDFHPLFPPMWSSLRLVDMSKVNFSNENSNTF